MDINLPAEIPSASHATSISFAQTSRAKDWNDSLKKSLKLLLAGKLYAIGLIG